MEDTKSKYEVFVITPTYTEEIKRLRDFFTQKYADERVNILIDSPAYDITVSKITKPQHVIYRWAGVIYHEEDHCTPISFEVNHAQYSQHNYDSWVALEKLSTAFPLKGSDIVIEDDGNINIGETMMNLNERWQ